MAVNLGYDLRFGERIAELVVTRAGIVFLPHELRVQRVAHVECVEQPAAPSHADEQPGLIVRVDGGVDLAVAIIIFGVNPDRAVGKVGLLVAAAYRRRAVAQSVQVREKLRLNAAPNLGTGSRLTALVDKSTLGRAEHAA